VSGAPTGGKNVRPDYLYNPHPAYPEESKTKGEQGVVMLLVGINEQGAVTSVSVRRSSGFPRLDSAAAEGVRSWRFRPARLAGFAVATTLDVPIHFSLSRQ
jgi:protein TonB